MKRNQIFSVSGRDYADMAVRIMKAADVASMIGDKNRAVALKPNLVVGSPAADGATTHPELLEGAIEYLKSEGFSNIWVMEGSWVGAKTMPAARNTGILSVCEKHGVAFFDMQRDGWVEKDTFGMRIKLCKKALEADFIINMPVMKGHCQTLVTCALKNFKGLIPDSEKRRFHTLGLDRPIALLNTLLRQDFILVDNICGDLDFEEGGNPVEMNRVLGFADPVLCDAFACESMGYAVDDVEYVRLAEKYGVGFADTSKAEFTELHGSGKCGGGKPRGRAAILARHADAKDACSACYGSLIYALNRLDEAGLLSRLDAKISIGQGFRGCAGGAGVGSCTSGFERHCPGCPPKASDILAFLQELMA